MNILPKKRWHVRTKDNIARVRRDEAEAADQEKERIQRAKLAEQESRTAYLRDRTRSKGGKEFEQEPPKKSDVQPKSSKVVEADIYTSDGNINFFKDIEDGKSSGTNKEHEAEKKAEQEKYEKNIGYLTYLGQDSLESKGQKAWYEANSVAKVDHSSTQEQSEEVGLKSKNRLDPINDIIKYTGLKPMMKRTIVSSISKVDLGKVKEKIIEPSAVVASKQRHKEEKCVSIKKMKREKKCKRKHRKEHKKKKKKKHKHTLKEKKRNGDSSKYHKKSKEREIEMGNRRKRKRDSSSDSDGRHTPRKRSRQNSGSSATNDSETRDTSSSYYSEDEEEQDEKQRKLEVLRAERLQREAEERKRAEKLLAGQKPEVVDALVANTATFQRKYNSQYNPHIARQNQETKETKETKTLEAGVKYWLQ